MQETKPDDQNIGYKTQPKDFSECHPFVAEQLKKGNAILCFYRTMEPDWQGPLMVEEYKGCRYRLENDKWCMVVRPVKFQTINKVIGIAALAKWLEDNQFRPKDDEYWTSPLYNEVYNINIFKFCGSDFIENWMPEQWSTKTTEMIEISTKGAYNR